MSFTLSNLGDFDGALRETKRALELDPYYVPQKFALAIDLEYEDPDLSVVPDLGGEQRMSGEVGREFHVRPAPARVALLRTRAAARARAPGGAGGRSLRDGRRLPHEGAVRSRRRRRRAAPFSAVRTRPTETWCSARCWRGRARRATRSSGIATRGAVRPDHARAMRGEAQALTMLGRGAEARLVAEQILQSSPEDVEILMLAASARFEAGDPAAALEALDVARRLAPQRAEVLRWIGNITRSVGDLEGAIAAYRHALNLDKDFAAVRFELARLLVRKSAWEDAERELVAALDTVPTYAEASLELASLKRVTGRPQEAVALLVDLLQGDPYNFEALIALGETLLTMGRTGDANIAFTRVRRFDPTHVGAIFYEGVLAARKKRYRDAIAGWQRVIDLEPAGEFARRARREMRTAQDSNTCSCSGGRRSIARGAVHGDRRSTPRTRHPRRLPAARPEPEDGGAARRLGTARQRGHGGVRPRQDRARRRSGAIRTRSARC